FNARKQMMAPTLNPGASLGNAAPGYGGSGYGQVMDGAMNLTLHTAKQIREDVATQRGMPLPDIINRRPGEQAQPMAAKTMGSMNQRRAEPAGGAGSPEKQKFVMTHTGVMGNPLGGDDDDDSAWQSYDYNSADGGEFHGRGYSSAGNRPGTTQQSQRSQQSGNFSGGEEEEEE
ncbi:hypothetical protein TeGR_g14129, partial [Tetraparma gracilis]